MLDAAGVQGIDSSSRGGTPTRVNSLRRLTKLEDLRSEWDAIEAPWLSPMQSYEWVKAWAEVYGLERDLEVLTEGRPATGIAPLVRSARGGHRLELAGPHQLGEVMDFLYSDDRSVTALVRSLADAGLPLRFWRLPADSPVVSAIAKETRRRGIIRCQSTAGVPSLPLDESWTDPERHLDSRRRSNVRRARRIAERMGPLTWEILSPKPHEVLPLLEEAYAVELEGWKGRAGAPLAREPLVGEFFRRYAVAAAERGTLRICFLRVNGRPIAMKLAAVAGNRFWLLAMGFSEEFEECSPGTLLLVETIRYAAKSGLRSYEFLGADEPWIRPWTQLVRPCVSVRTYPRSWAGAAALVSDGTAWVRDRVKPPIAAVGRRLQQGLERRTAGAYVAGPKLEDAILACRALSASGFASTIGYVNAPNDSPRTVAERYAGMIDGIAGAGLDCYASIKAPLIGFSRTLARGIADRARQKTVGLHFDALGPEDVDKTFSLIEEVRTVHPAIGCTLPSRWRRSVPDAARAIELGLNVRIVRGEWADSREREVDPVTGWMAIVDRIAGKVPHVAIATHNPKLARQALRRLRAEGTPCSLEVLLGYPIRRVGAAAAAERVPIRIYVPFGSPSLPYSLADATKRPRVAWWTLRDLYMLAKFRGSRSPGIPERYDDLRARRFAFPPKARKSRMSVSDEKGTTAR